MEKKKVNHTHTFYKQARKCVNIFICGFHLVALSQYLRLSLSVDLISINIKLYKRIIFCFESELRVQPCWFALYRSRAEKVGS